MYSYDADTYTAINRLSPPCASLIAQNIIGEILPGGFHPIVDIGCGDAYLSSLLMGMSEPVNCVLLDISQSFLNKAREKLSLQGFLNRVDFVRADAHHIPITCQVVPAVLMAFVLHLLTNPLRGLSEIHRILVPGGYYFLVTYDPDDMNSQILHRFFPGYRELAAEQFLPIDRLVQLLKGIGFVRVTESKYPYEMCLDGVDAAIQLVQEKSFSTLHRYSGKAFRENLARFAADLHKHFGSGEVVYQSKVTLLAMEKADNAT